MKKRLESKLNMYDAVVNCCNSNSAIIATVPAFQASQSELAAKATAIRSSIQEVTKIITGVAMGKSDQQKGLARQAANISAAVYAFASASGNIALKQEMKYRLTNLLRMKDEVLGPVCQNIHAVANANIADLADYNITAPLLTGFSAAIDAYIASVPSTRNAVASRATALAALDTLFADADDIVKNQMDKTAQQFLDAHPDFYKNYRTNRIILDPASTHSQIRGKVLKAGSPLPLAGASVEVVGGSITATSDAKGIFRFKPIQPGTYSLKVTLEGYAERTIDNVLVKLGRSANTVVEMIQHAVA
jgi:hypothetical protein